jgi:hypothetical protein
MPETPGADHAVNVGYCKQYIPDQQLISKNEMIKSLTHVATQKPGAQWYVTERAKVVRNGSRLSEYTRYAHRSKDNP